jgi:hypothetical protein
MRRLIGYSTGALAKGDFRHALDLLRRHRIGVVELSALRDTELVPLLNALDSLDLRFASYLSFHAPSAFRTHTETEAARLLRTLLPRHWPIILHPDAVTDASAWQDFGAWICIENMDKRKPVGRTVEELQRVFDIFPHASFCFDIGHARQVDPTMGQATLILQRFGDRLKQVHMSEVNSRNGHDPMSVTAINAFRKVAHLIPPETPIILETVIPESMVEAQIALAVTALAKPEGSPNSGPQAESLAGFLVGGEREDFS